MGVVTPRFDSYQDTTMTSPIEYTAIKSGIISIVVIWLSIVRAAILGLIVSALGILDGQPQLFLERHQAYCNSKGMLGADDLVGTVLFLLSSTSRYINGQNLIVDDGWSL